MKNKIIAVIIMMIFSIPYFSMVSPAEEIYELVVETVTFDQENPGCELIEEAVNKITVPEIGVKINLKNMSISQHERQIGQMINNNEKLDLVMVGLSYPINEMVADSLLMPLNELLPEYGQGLIELFGDKLKAGYIGSNLYAVPAKINSVMSAGMLYNTEMAFQAGINIPKKCSIYDMADIFAAVKENVDNVYMTSFMPEVSMMGFLYDLEGYGSRSYAFGVTFKPWDNTDIVNLYDSEQYLEYCSIMRDWNEKGYFPPNIMTSSILPTERLREDQIFCLFTGYSPMAAPGELVGENTDIVQTIEAVSSTSLLQERMWGIPVNCKNPEKAIQFLELLFRNDEMANILMNGIEGVHYTKVSDHVITHTDNTDYKRVFTIFGDQHKILQWFPAEENIMDEQMEFENNAKQSMNIGYIFDNTPVLRETEAVNKIISMYGPALEFGMVDDVEAAIAEFNRELDKAGINTIIEENRRQLAEWMKEQNK